MELIKAKDILIKDFYNKNAKKYINLRNHYWSKVRKFFNLMDDIVIKENISNPTFLDLGCAHGKYFYLTKNYQSYGLDISDVLVSKAKVLHPETNIQVGTVLDLPYPDNIFNFIISVSVIHYLEYSEQEIMVKEIIKVLKPGGFCFLSGLTSISTSHYNIFKDKLEYANLLESDSFDRLFNNYINQGIIEIIQNYSIENSKVIIFRKNIL